MGGSRVALAAANRFLTSDIESYLKEHCGLTAFTDSFQGVREVVDQNTDGLLLLGVANDADLVEATHLLQELNLQKIPVLAIIVDSHPDELKVESIARFAARRVRWPVEAIALQGLVREVGRGPLFQRVAGDSLEDLLGRRILAQTPSLVPLVDRIALAATHDVTVLLTGETGSGKTFLARLMHEHSPRKDHRFMAIPCGAITANLIESEFFGHVRGAFTGADRPKIGKFAAVGAGTLLLDEIDTLALEQQATLLRVIETGEFEPVGGNDTQKCAARLIVASNLDLEVAAAKGRFRADLYFRLNVMSFHLPPLRERVQDIAFLARGMAARFNRKFNKDLFDIHPEAIASLEAYAWPGNLRQLENVVQHAVLVSSGPQLLPAHLPAVVQDQPVQSTTAIAGDGDSLHHQRDLTERSVIQRALVTNGYSRTRAADSLGISRVTLYKKMKKYGLMKQTPTPVK